MKQYKRNDLFKHKVHTAVFQIYPELVSDLIDRNGAEKAAEDLREIGNRIANQLTNFWTPKSKKIKDIIKEMYKKFWAGEPKVKITEDKIIVRDRNCLLCTSGAELTAFHLCTPISSFAERMLEILSMTRTFPFTKTRGTTVKSKGAGDEYCEHEIELIKEADIWKARREEEWSQKS